MSTSQPIDSPLLELLECDLGRGGDFVEAQAVRVVLLFICGNCELFLLVINRTSSFGVNSIIVLSYHLCSSQFWKCKMKSVNALKKMPLVSRIDAQEDAGRYSVKVIAGSCIKPTHHMSEL